MEAYTLISGATSGIGQATAIFMSQTRNVILMGRDETKLKNTISQCSHNCQIESIVCDLDTDIALVFSKISDVLRGKGIVVDSFIHCAGVTKILPLRSFPLSDTQSIFNINVISAIEIIKALVKRENHKALRNIILVSALWSIRGDRANSIYASSKGAINSLVPSLAKELAPIRINAILPGGVETPMTAELMHSELGQLLEKEYPLGYGTIEDIVNMIDFLLSDKSRWITGQLISVDGGRSIM